MLVRDLFPCQHHSDTCGQARTVRQSRRARQPCDTTPLPASHLLQRPCRTGSSCRVGTPSRHCLARRPCDTTPLPASRPAPPLQCTHLRGTAHRRGLARQPCDTTAWLAARLQHPHPCLCHRRSQQGTALQHRPFR
eukprot:Mycagemm_TRINITY_DN10305_c3_g2::TRINITY_DN10305_c3_g2_i1::g.1298::m.1298 type:complete len:136 gc:universal TRINITY_DN10305_c3_g2_i1:777-1184(+)